MRERPAPSAAPMPPAGLTSRARRRWLELGRALPEGAAADPPTAVDVPACVHRWLGPMLDPAGPVVQPWVHLAMEGEIRLGGWRRFRAEQLLAPGTGYVWAARTRVCSVPIAGYDALVSGRGEMDWGVGGIGLLRDVGDDVTRSSAGRCAAEVALWPAAFPLFCWEEGEAAGTARATRRLAGVEESVDLAFDDEGGLREVSIQRWGKPRGADWGRHTFTVEVDENTSYCGVPVPRRFRAGWRTAGDGEFLRATILAATPTVAAAPRPFVTVSR